MKQYFLFGEDAIVIYNQEGIKGLKRESKANNTSFGLFMYDKLENNPIDLLNAGMGWNDCTTITEEEFNFLNG